MFFWLIEPGTRHLTTKAKDILISADDVYFSIVSMWEIATKAVPVRFESVGFPKAYG